MVVTDCPYCNEPMVSGEILGDKYALRWKDDDQELLMGTYAPLDSIIISKPTFRRSVLKVLLTEPLFRKYVVKGYICKKCRKIVIDY